MKQKSTRKKKLLSSFIGSNFYKYNKCTPRENIYANVKKKNLEIG